MAKREIKYNPEIKHYIIALSTTLRDYRMCFFINKVLYLDLKKVNDFAHADKSKSKVNMHSFFKCTDGYVNIDYYLVQNKVINSYIIKSLKNFDYLFIIKTLDEEKSIDVDHIVKQLSIINEIQLIHKVDSLKAADLKFIANEF